MKNLSKDINILIKKELSLFNKKLNGLLVLEKLKYNIKDKLKIDNNIVNLKIEDYKNSNHSFEDEFRKIEVNIFFNKTPSIQLNSELKKNSLLVCIKEMFNIKIDDDKKKKNFTYKCLPFTGIILSKGSKYSLNYAKESVILELNIEDKIMDIENLVENTI